MRLANLTEFRNLIYTPTSAPTVKTLRARIDAGKIAGGLVDDDGHYYVDLDAYERRHNLRASVAARHAELENDPRLRDLL